MGIRFPNPVGLAAGLDKNGEYIDALGALGFGFIEVGTVTPRPQPGNPRPRLFRLPAARAVINRMGFNNQGVDRVVDNVRRARWHGVLGVNIGKNFDTPLERALDDYLTCLGKVYSVATYVTINISSPNTRGLRDLQGSAELDGLLSGLTAERARLADRFGRYVPLALKIAPDLEDDSVHAVADMLVEHRMDAVVATNTTIAREAVRHLPHGEEAGGLSGAPVFEASNRVITRLRAALGAGMPIIGVGGVMSGADAAAKIAAGADLVQLYTGFIYRGPSLVSEAARAIAARG